MPGKVVMDAKKKQFSESRKGKMLSLAERMKVKITLSNLMNSHIYVTAKTIEERSYYVDTWLE